MDILCFLFQSLYLLLQCGHNVEEALRRRKMQAIPPTGILRSPSMNLYLPSYAKASMIECHLKMKVWRLFQSAYKF